MRPRPRRLLSPAHLRRRRRRLSPRCRRRSTPPPRRPSPAPLFMAPSRCHQFLPSAAARRLQHSPAAASTTPWMPLSPAACSLVRHSRPPLRATSCCRRRHRCYRSPTVGRGAARRLVAQKNSRTACSWPSAPECRGGRILTASSRSARGSPTDAVTANGLPFSSPRLPSSSTNLSRPVPTVPRPAVAYSFSNLHMLHPPLFALLIVAFSPLYSCIRCPYRPLLL
ncbi:hypothetical protein EXIGLDRAFT_441604 [Exidia glandulosa HHB12029]|uniref:Uncharacterized protein n=1 Tax=Exidia glandulosa HHB12029 TaxID=1314781 RepID=A0A165KB09_EXIGL|nr:hypothetical protein EXIGLDRAFT_441604 [Exidia glandulosa HHB12029]